MTGLKLREDAYYVPTDEGICILTNSGEVVLTGPSIYKWIDRLAPYLDGSHTLEELTASMPADRKAMTERVISALREQRLIADVPPVKKAGDPGCPLTGTEWRAYRREIGFLGFFGRPGRSFRAYRDSVVVLLGAGRLLVETAAAAFCSGSRRVRVFVTGECPTDMAQLAECEQHSRQRDPDQRITHHAADLADEERLSDMVAGAGVVVYACDRGSVDTARTLDRVCERAGVRFVSAVLAGEEAWLGPFGPTTGQWPSWLGAWRRLLAHGSGGTGRPEGAAAAGHGGFAAAAGDLWTGAAPTVAAGQLIREVVRLLSGTAEQTSQARMTRLDLPSLRTAQDGFMQHPFSVPASPQDEDGLRVTVGRLGEGQRLDSEEFSHQVTACLQPRLGVLGEVTERDFTQLPLAISQVEVSDPVLLLGPDVQRPVAFGADLSLADARRAAVLRGLAAYGSLMVDPRRLHVREGTVHPASPCTGDPFEGLVALLAGQWSGYIWGYGLADGLPYELPAAAVFPALRGVRSSYEPPAGAAAGYDWAEAVRNGLLGQCRRMTLAELAESRGPFTPIEWTEVALDESGDRYRSLVRMIGQRLDVFDVTGSARVPTLAFCLDDVTVGYASGLSFDEALRDGLADVLLSYQAGANREPDYAPVPVPPLPPRGRTSRLAACPEWSTGEAATAARLVELGRPAVVVPLDHDPGVTASIMPYLVHVVLTRA
ncbi:MAG TPA: YcaO-like family protein [Actinomycetes bacterium]|nr:YcaO-like family protein [Actinomycetes bacterium]